MSEDFRHLYCNNGFQEENDDRKYCNNTNISTSTLLSADHRHHRPHPCPNIISSSSRNFNEVFLLQGSNDRQELYYSDDVYGLSTLQQQDSVPPTPNSSISSDSTEAAMGYIDHIQQDSNSKVSSKDGGKDESVTKETLEDDEDPLIEKKEGNNNNKGKKKAEKKQRPPSFAFMTESEVDHLEDGYRWRKYGQKAVKNSRYPRSYYRCTTQKCPVKKRIERSFENPTIVITTYEGQHNHQVPASLRGPTAAGIFSPPMLGHHPLFLDQVISSSPSFHHRQEVLLLSQMPPQYFHGNNCNGGVGTSSNIPLYDSPRQEKEHQSINVDPDHQQPQQFDQFQGYGLLQDMMKYTVLPKQ